MALIDPQALVSFDSAEGAVSLLAAHPACPRGLPGSVNRSHSPAGQAIPAVALTLLVAVVIAPTLLLTSKGCHLASYWGILSSHGCEGAQL